MRLGFAALVVLTGLIAGPGCASEEEGLPAACLEGRAATLRALADAPREVRLGEARLSECVSRARGGGELASVGSGLLAAAAELSGAAAAEPEGPEALRLGYLVGAVRRGVARSHGASELVRRLEVELARVGRLSNALRRGERAGRAGG